MNARSALVVGVLVALLGALLVLPRLGASGLWDPWEPRYAQAAREMAQRGDWIVPHYRDDERINRAPLTYWLIGGSQALTGVNERSARLPSAVLAVTAAAFLAWGLAAAGRAREGLVAGLALITAPQWYLLARFATPDVPLGASCALVLAGALAWRAGSRSAGVLVVAGVALAALSEWPRGLLLPAWSVLGWRALAGDRSGPAVFVAFGALYHVAQLTYSGALNFVVAVSVVLAVPWALRRSGLRPLSVAACGLAIAGLVAPWFVAVSMTAPADELSIFTYKYAFNLGETIERHRGSYLEVAEVLAVGGLPWTAAAAAGLTRAFSRRKKDRDRHARIAAGAWIGGFAFFLLAEPRMGHLVSVLQPVQAVLAGIGLVALAERRRPAIAAALVAIGATATLVARDPSRILDAATVKSSLFGISVTGPVLAAVAAWSVAAALVVWRRGGASFALAAIPPAVFVAFLGWSVVPALGPKKSLAAHWRVYEARGGAEPIALHGRSKDSLYYYSDLGVERLRSTAELTAWLARPGPKWVVARSATISRLSRRPGAEPIETEHPTHGIVRMVGSGRVERSGNM